MPFGRTFGYQAAGVNDQYLSQVVTSPLTLLSRLLLGYKVTLGWGWTTSIIEFFPGVSGAKSAFLLVTVILILLWLTSWVLLKLKSRRDEKASNNHRTFAERLPKIYPYVVALICGVLLIGAGYIPTITVFLPGLSGIGSRFNIFATIGGSVTIAAFLMICSMLIASEFNHEKYYFLISAMLFCFHRDCDECCCSI